MVMSSQCLDQPVRLSKLFLKKAPQLWAKTSPGSSMGVDPPRQKLAPQHGRDTCTFNGAKLPPRATHSTQDGEGCLCNFLFRLSLDAKLTECYWYVAHKGPQSIFQHKILLKFLAGVKAVTSVCFHSRQLTLPLRIFQTLRIKCQYSEYHSDIVHIA